jgi:hypothetical protein
VIGEAQSQPRSHLFRLFAAFGVERTVNVRKAIFGFGVTPEYEFHRVMRL